MSASCNDDRNTAHADRLGGNRLMTWNNVDLIYFKNQYPIVVGMTASNEDSCSTVRLCHKAITAEIACADIQLLSFFLPNHIVSSWPGSVCYVAQ